MSKIYNFLKWENLKKIKLLEYLINKADKDSRWWFLVILVLVVLPLLLLAGIVFMIESLITGVAVPRIEAKSLTLLFVSLGVVVGLYNWSKWKKNVKYALGVPTTLVFLVWALYLYNDSWYRYFILKPIPHNVWDFSNTFLALVVLFVLNTTLLNVDIDWPKRWTRRLVSAVTVLFTLLILFGVVDKAFWGGRHVEKIISRIQNNVEMSYSKVLLEQNKLTQIMKLNDMLEDYGYADIAAEGKLTQEHKDRITEIELRKKLLLENGLREERVKLPITRLIIDRTDWKMFELAPKAKTDKIPARRIKWQELSGRPFYVIFYDLEDRQEKVLISDDNRNTTFHKPFRFIQFQAGPEGALLQVSFPKG